MEKINTKQPSLSEAPSEHDTPTQPKEEVDLTIIRNPEIDAIPEGPLKLLSAVAALQRRRHARLEALEREANRAYEKAYAAALPALMAEREEAKRKHEAEVRAERRRRYLETTFARRDRERLDKARREREERRRDLERMSLDELWGEIEETVAMESDLLGRMTPKPGEEEEAMIARMEDCLKTTRDIYQIGFSRLMEGNVRYFEGLPLNVRASHPSIVSIMFPIPRLPSDSEPCLNCQTKSLRCSHSFRDIYTHALPSSACARCVRSGHRCVVKWPPHPERPKYYFLADEGWSKDEDVVREREEVVAELWERREEMNRERKRAWPAWHGNDKRENTMDPDYKRKGWWHQLRDKTIQW